jgi:uncharacterized protein
MYSKRTRFCVRKELVEREADQVKLVATVAEKLAGLREDMTRVEAEREEAELQIPAAAKVDYTRLVAARGEEAIAPIEDQNCGGCNQMLTTQIANQIAMSRLVRCPTCGAFLYRREGAQVG